MVLLLNNQNEYVPFFIPPLKDQYTAYTLRFFLQFFKQINELKLIFTRKFQTLN